MKVKIIKPLLGIKYYKQYVGKIVKVLRMEESLAAGDELVVLPIGNKDGSSSITAWSINNGEVEIVPEDSK